MSAKVNVLLSTYNGSKHLSEQLDSLLAQTYPNITIYVRDDGSTDNTVEILSRYKSRCEEASKEALKESPRMVILHEDDSRNLGYMESFWTLLRKCETADYYAFCDQDDIWLPEKIERGVAALQAEDGEIPLLYSSNYVYCDENMNRTGEPTPMKTPILLKDLLFYTPAFGFTVLINSKLREVALSSSSLKNIPHDGWCQKIAGAMGKFIYDAEVTALYRRHSQTVTYANSNKMQLVKKWFQNDIMGVGLKEYHQILERFQEEYGDKLTVEDSEVLNLFAGDKVSLPVYFRRLFFGKRLRPSMGGELALRLCFLLNK